MLARLALLQIRTEKGRRVKRPRRQALRHRTLQNRLPSLILRPELQLTLSPTSLSKSSKTQTTSNTSLPLPRPPLLLLVSNLSASLPGHLLLINVVSEAISSISRSLPLKAKTSLSLVQPLDSGSQRRPDPTTTLHLVQCCRKECTKDPINLSSNSSPTSHLLSART